MGRKLGDCVPFSGRGAGSHSPSSTMWRGPRPTSMPSFILIHPTVWPQYTNVTDRTDRQTTVGQHRENRFTNGRPKTHEEAFMSSLTEVRSRYRPIYAHSTLIRPNYHTTRRLFHVSLWVCDCDSHTVAAWNESWFTDKWLTVICIAPCNFASCKAVVACMLGNIVKFKVHPNITSINQSNLFVTQNYTIPIKDGKIEQCVNRTQRQLRATLTGAQTDIYGKLTQRSK